jgi:transposase-like protein
MNTPRLNDRYKNHWFPLEIISLAVWLHFRLDLSYRDAEYRSSRGLGVTASTPAATDSPIYCR